MKDTDVLIVADVDDPHAVLVESRLVEQGSSVLKLNLGTLRSVSMTADQQTLTVVSDQEIHRISSRTSVWWHRAGRTPVDGLDREEANLVADENPHTLIGALDACRVRWVDPPHLVARAEKKLYQLSIANRLGIRTPETLVTNEPARGRDFQSVRQVITKTLSPGVGIAPFTSRVAESDIDRVSANPALLQEFVEATADARVVVVNGQSWVWVRPRKSGMVDWRAEDPQASRFKQRDMPVLSTNALQVTAALDLTMSVQDWLVTPAGNVFLEINPQGGWHFLDGAPAVVVPALSSHLVKTDREASGIWPPAIRRFLWDFLPASRAPNNDGISPPQFASPIWIDEVATWDGALDVARRGNDSAQESAKTAEDKASRLVQISLTLITISIALATFQLTAAIGESRLRLLLVLPALIAISFIVLAATEALEIDRVGVYGHAQPGDLKLSSARTQPALALDAEERGRRLARWTANNKLTDLMQARAWFSRGLAALLVAALVAGMTFAVDSEQRASGSTSISPTTNSTAAGTDPTPPPGSSSSTSSA